MLFLLSLLFVMKVIAGIVVPDPSPIAVKALEQVLATVKNPYEEMLCREGSSSSQTGAADAACENLHAFSCSQQVVRDPLSASYATATKFKEFAENSQAPIMKVIGDSMLKLAADKPEVALSLEQLDKFSGGREKTLACIYQLQIEKINLLKGTLEACPGFNRHEAWLKLNDLQEIVDLTEVIPKAFDKFITDSSKHKMVEDKIFPKAKSLMIELMEEQANLNSDKRVVFNQMRDQLSKVALVEPELKWVYQDSNMYYNPKDNNVTCNHSSVVMGSFSDIAHGVLHELSHSIDPCGGVAIMGALNNKPEFPLGNILACIERETKIEMGQMINGRFDCEQSAESFSDFIATLLLPKLLPEIYGDSLKSPDDYAQVYAGIGRSFNHFCDDKSSSRYTSWANRINLLVGSNPVIRAQLGCQDVLVPGSGCFTEIQLPVKSDGSK